MGPRHLMQDLDSTTWTGLALLPARLALESASALLAMTGETWLLSFRLGCHSHEPHAQLVVPEPIEGDNEHGLFA